jgi:hypothetical protein
MIFNWKGYTEKDPSVFSVGQRFLTLMECDFPLLFISTIGNDLYLNYFIDYEDGGNERYLHGPISESRAVQLAEGNLPLRECLNAGNVHVYDINTSGKVSFVAELDFNSIPVDALPPDGLCIPAIASDYARKTKHDQD